MTVTTTTTLHGQLLEMFASLYEMLQRMFGAHPVASIIYPVDHMTAR
jgi:hypothetical protein